MKKNLSPRDWELLSSYMDGQLSNGKRAQLEARLDINPDLRAALDDLTRTRAMLRSLPRVKAPRSFKITPEMVGQREPRRLYPFFQLASALTSVMLVLVLLTDFLGFRFQAPLGGMTAQSPEPTIPAEVMLESAPPALMAEDAPDARKSMPQEAPAPAEGAVEEVLPFEAPAGEPAGEEPAAEQELFMAAPASPEATPDIEAGSTGALTVPVVPDAPPAQLPEAAFEEAEQQSDAFLVEEEAVRGNGLSSMRVLQISLAVIAAASALIALYLRRLGT